MAFQVEPNTIRWKMHFASPPSKLYDALNTASGRASFWAESAIERDNQIEFRILNYEPFNGRIVRREPPGLFTLDYFGSVVEFILVSDGAGGTDLTLTASEVDESIRMEMVAGWVSVLMALKGAVDFGVDLRNHDPRRSWVQGYADN